MKTRIIIIVAVVIALTITFFVVGPSQGHIAQYFLTDEQFEKWILNNPSVIDTVSECNQPPSPHEFALWNEKHCWWFLYEPLVPFERINFISSFSWDTDSEGVFEKLCKDNKGLWFPNNELWFPNNVQCKFIHYADGKKFEAILESNRNIKISGIQAQHICEIVNFVCPENPEFDGRYNQSFKKIYVNLYNQGTQYIFRLINDTMSYKISTENKSGEWIEDIKK